MTFCRVRQRICSDVGECTRTVGWIAPNSFAVFSGALFTHEAADASDEGDQSPEYRSMCTIQPACSVLDPASITPLPSSTGFARMGPRVPAGRCVAGDQVRAADAGGRVRRGVR